MGFIKCFIYTILLYRAEIWTLNKKLERRMNAAGMCIYRKVGHYITENEKKKCTSIRSTSVQHELLKEIRIQKIIEPKYIKKT